MVLLYSSLGFGEREGERLEDSSRDGGQSEIGLNCTELELGLRGGRVRLRKEVVYVFDRWKGILGVVITSCLGATFLIIGDALIYDA